MYWENLPHLEKGWVMYCFFFKKKPLLTLCRFHIMHSDPASLSVPVSLNPPSALATSPQSTETKQQKTNQPNEIKQKEEKSCCGSCSVACESRSLRYSSFIFSCECSLPWAIGLALGLWFQLHHWWWAPTGTLLRYPVFVMHHGDPAV